MPSESYVESHIIGLEDSFYLDCQQCARCCYNRIDLILPAYDLFRIAKYLNMTLPEMIEKYCEVFIDQKSILPLVKVKTKINKNVCTFLRGTKCMIHEVNPTVCALFPLARIYSPDGKTRYMLNEISCEQKTKEFKVSEWLEIFGIAQKDETYQLWYDTMVELTKYMFRLRKDNKSDQDLRPIWYLIYQSLYLDYDLNKDFLPQIKENVTKLKGLLAEA